MDEQRPQTVSRISDEEKTTIKNVFKGNEPLLKLMRKMFWPEIDPNAPIGYQIDLYLTRSVLEMTPEDAKVWMTAREMLVKHVEACLSSLQAIAEAEIPSPIQLAEAQRKGSSK